MHTEQKGLSRTALLHIAQSLSQHCTFPLSIALYFGCSFTFGKGRAGPSALPSSRAPRLTLRVPPHLHTDAGTHVRQDAHWGPPARASKGQSYTSELWINARECLWRLTTRWRRRGELHGSLGKKGPSTGSI